jgi:hypothetical protein
VLSGHPVSLFAEYQHAWWQDANFNMAFNAAADAAKALGRPGGGIEETACVLIDWAMDHHGAWFRVLER